MMESETIIRTRLFSREKRQKTSEMTGAEIIKEILSQLNLNSNAFASSIGLSRAQNIYDIESGKVKRISPTIADKIKQKYPQFNRAWLLTGEGSPNVKKTYTEELRDHKNVDRPFMVPFVPVKAQAGYARSFGNSEFINELELYPILPGVDHRGAIWRFFEVQGDSMEPELFEKDHVLVSLVPNEDWSDVKQNQVYVIVTEDDVLIKKVNKIDSERWMLTSSNKRHKPRPINVSDIKELWMFRTFSSKVLNRK